MRINFDDDRINYMGRIDNRTDGAYFYFAASSASVRFNGTEISVEINNKTVWGTCCLGYVIDGRMAKVPLLPHNDGKYVTYQLASGLEPYIEHTLIVYKRHDANQSFSLRSISTDGVVLPAAEKPKLKLEFYGDSVTAGAFTEADGFEQRSDPMSAECCYDNSWYSYSMQTALKLGAQIHDIAQGGISIHNNMGYFHMPDTIGMESVYDKMCYFPEAGEISKWSFSRYTPDIVVFALGQNDRHNAVTNTDDVDIYDRETRKNWKNSYKKIVRSVNSHYGVKTKYIFLLTLLNHDVGWDTTVDEIVDELKADGLDAYHLVFKCDGITTPGHPRRSEQERMANELTEFIKRIM